jgi:hypothetical protein
LQNAFPLCRLSTIDNTNLAAVQWHKFFIVLNHVFEKFWIDMSILYRHLINHGRYAWKDNHGDRSYKQTKQFLSTKLLFYIKAHPIYEPGYFLPCVDDLT